MELDLQTKQLLSQLPMSLRLPIKSTTRTLPGNPIADSNCPYCGGLGVFSLNVPIADPRFGKLIDCDCTATVRSARLQALSGLNEDERLITLGDIVVRPYKSCPVCKNTRRVQPDGRSVPCDACYNGTAEMVQAARQFVANPIGLVTFYGTSGNAKTLVLQAIVNACLQQNIEAVYILMADLLDYIRAAFDERQSGHSESALLRLERFMNLKILVIDEADKANATGWVIERETKLFDKRYRDALAHLSGTVIALNEPDKMPDWIWSRLRDGRGQSVHNPDRDMRPLMK